MQSNVVLRLRDPFLLDLSTYLSVAAMALLGVSGLPNLSLQLAALALCLTFALLYRFVFRTNYYERNPVLYFGAQAIVMVMLLLSSEASDFFNFLFYLLTIQTAVVLNIRRATMWTAIYFGISAFAVFIARGTDGLFAILFYLVVFVICAVMGHSIQQADLAREHNEQLLNELQATQQKLRDLAVVEERNRLARDLHDSVKQQVFAMSMQLGAARTALSETDQAYSSVIEAERLAQQAGAELSTLISALRPPSLENKTLTTAVREHVNEWSRQNKISTDLDIDSNILVNPHSEQVLFRVLQEALANVARHSEANEVRVSLNAEKDDVTLLIEDNGIGFDTKQITKGVGLDSMKERLTAVNGTLEVTSIKPQGTRLTAKVRRS
ncbi:MAG TPA: sensor histidine kinase [Anaerolineales bacterium]|nr:sensor histidine kinase [Anaerolineales bacterium]